MIKGCIIFVLVCIAASTGQVFQSPASLSTGGSPVVLADFNADGKLDIAAVNGNSVVICLGNGDGTFGPPITVLTLAPSSSLWVAVADVNKDGIADLIVSRSGQNNDVGDVQVLLGVGNGTFQAPAIFAAGNYPAFVVVADIDADGKLDLVVGNGNNPFIVGSNGAVSVMKGNGDGTFLAPITTALTMIPTALVVEDFNGDAKADIAVVGGRSGSTPNTVTILLGNGTGTFQAPHILPTGTDPESIAAADLNGDGKRDLVVGNRLDESVQVFLGQGDGNFVQSALLPVSGGPTQIITGDFTGSGRVDLAVSAHNGAMQLFPGIGDGTFKPFLRFQGGTDGLTSGDITGTGLPSFVMAGTPIKVLIQHPDHSIESPLEILAGHNIASIVHSDLNQDGNLDLVFSDDTGLHTMLGKGDLTFGGIANLISGPVPLGFVVADINGDGIPDVVVFNSQTADSLLGNGDGTFTRGPSLPFPAGTNPIGRIALAADVNGDGILDLLVTAFDRGVNVISTNEWLLLGNGDGSFQSPIHIATLTEGAVASVADLNDDGRTDLVVSNFPSTFDVYIANAAGGFNPAVTYSTGSLQASGTNLAIDDYNLDGKLDIVEFENGTVFWPGDGAGNLITPPVPISPLGFGPAPDLNFDGKPDIFLGSGIAFGNGDGTFQPPIPCACGTANFDIADLDNDGRPDLIESDGIFIIPRKNILASPAGAVLVKPASPIPGIVGQALTLSATVVPLSGTNIPSGTINWKKGPLLLGSSQLVGGKGQITISTLPLGLHRITAEYSGDTVFSSNRASFEQPISRPLPPDFRLAATSTGATIKPGQSAQFGLTVAPLHGLNATIAFSCAGLPAGAQCAFSPASVPPGSASTNVTLTISTAGPNSGTVTSVNLPSPGSQLPTMVFGSGLLVFLLLRRKKQGLRLQFTFGLVAALLFISAGCGGGTPLQPGSPTISGTPLGTSSVVVTASVAGGPSHQTVLTLVVN